jgi:hypothetical protein
VLNNTFRSSTSSSATQLAFPAVASLNRTEVVAGRARSLA